ncbi:unnamed protein product, partial [Fusarium graminearum]
ATNLHFTYKNSASAIKQPKASRKGNKRLVKRSLDHIDRFFVKYPNFNYDSLKPIWIEFNDMCDFFEWDNEDKEMKIAKGGFKEAIVKQFNDIYGTDLDNLDSWQKLCYMLNIKPVPTNLAECREVGLMASSSLLNYSRNVRRIHVNLADLVETEHTGLPVEAYTANTGKFFPKKSAYEGGLLRFLLRRIL